MDVLIDKVMDLSEVDYGHTVSSLKEEVEKLSHVTYNKDYEIERLKIELRKSCTLMEVSV